mmetsp:Transcript_21642/g.60230  ORF Transcript_21642/g.60230 Transcript_21642/m.60230 type:complete len:228 (+) Transcript_21642:672-1355(+)
MDARLLEGLAHHGLLVSFAGLHEARQRRVDLARVACRSCQQRLVLRAVRDEHDDAGILARPGFGAARRALQARAAVDGLQGLSATGTELMRLLPIGHGRGVQGDFVFGLRQQRCVRARVGEVKAVGQIVWIEFGWNVDGEQRCFIGIEAQECAGRIGRADLRFVKVGNLGIGFEQAFRGVAQHHESGIVPVAKFFQLRFVASQHRCPIQMLLRMRLRRCLWRFIRIL